MDYGPAPESDAHARAWLKDHKEKFGHFIGGKWLRPKDGKYFKTVNPATGEKLAEILDGTAKDVDDAVKAARKALPAWQALPPFRRAKYLYAIARLLQKHGRLFAVVETLDNGKPVRETRDIDVPLAARHFYHHAGWAQLLETEFPGYEGCGVVGQVIPWNFPLLMLAWKIAPALAAGNTVVLKPAEFTPLSAALFAEICVEAGLPDGVVNIVQGAGKTGAALVAHDDVDKIAFTGSTEVGRIIRAATAGSGKALTLELGGKSPMIVFDDADLDAAVEGVVDGIWFNQGEVCCAGSRMLVQEGIAGKIHKKLARRMENFRIGNPLDKSVDMGAVVDKSQFDNITAMIKTGVKEGAELIQPAPELCPVPEKGWFIPPTVLANVSPSSSVAEKEIFGPVLSTMTFRTPDEAVALANNTRYGLAAGIWSENINLALDLAPKLKAGVVWVNSANLFDAACGFGGYRESGFGREGGREGMYAYLKKSVIKKLKPYAPREKDFISKKQGLKSVSASGGLIDQTPKFFIGGKQTRPDGNYSLSVLSPSGEMLGQTGEGNRKDIRNAVEAARKAEGWSKAAHHLRAQILYYIAENLERRKSEFAARITAMTGVTKAKAAEEVELSLERLFTYGAWCDKYEGAVHTPPMRAVAVAMKEPVGIMGIVCPDEAPLLGFISLLAPAIAMGNRAVILPSEQHPLAATDFYQVLETSDVPAGVVNIVTGWRKELTKTLAEHDNIDALWYFGPDAESSAFVEKASVTNLKRTWCNYGLKRDWFNAEQAEGEEFLRHAVEIKNIWIPYGEQV
ncbi:MAG: aldehyde dehydrogenase family protein [Micavibrio sp.]|nr:MAG: aldehyde dehydrogenase family protein [Micavibrio sp.]